MGGFELSLLSLDDVWDKIAADTCAVVSNCLNVIDSYYKDAAGTDLSFLTCVNTFLHSRYERFYRAEYDNLKGRTCGYWTKTLNDNGKVIYIDDTGSSYKTEVLCNYNYLSIRPVLYPHLSEEEFLKFTQNRVKGYRDTYEMEYGEYPQYITNKDMHEELENALSYGNIVKTGKSYTFNEVEEKDGNFFFNQKEYFEYMYHGKKYIRIKAYFFNYSDKLSDGLEHYTGEDVWIEISPVTWLIDDEKRILVSKLCLLSGIRIDGEKYNGNFEETEMYQFLNNYMLKDMLKKSSNIDLSDLYGINDNSYDNLLNQLLVENDLSNDELNFLRDAIEEEKNSVKKRIKNYDVGGMENEY